MVQIWGVVGEYDIVLFWFVILQSELGDVVKGMVSETVIRVLSGSLMMMLVGSISIRVLTSINSNCSNIEGEQ